MTIDINKIIEGAVAVPYSQEMLGCLKSACESYMQDDSDYKRIEEMVGTFLEGTVTDEFKAAIESELEEKGLGRVIPDNVMVRLSLYAICCCFNDDNDDLGKAIRATIFMNYMIVKKTQLDTLPNSTYIKDLYLRHISYYIAENDSIRIGEKTNLIGKIAEKGIQTLMEENEIEEDEKQLRMLVKEASLYRMMSSLGNYSIRDINNPYVRVYKGLRAVVDSMEYLYYYIDLQGIITSMIKPEEEGKGKRRKLASFIDELERSHQNNNEPRLKSSILLRLISKKDSEDLERMKDMSFGVREFATYLYYELLLEKIISKESE